MNVRFVAADPRNRAIVDLDRVLSHGADQLAIACAFLTPGGVETLKRHAARLRLSDSFVVVAWEKPTSLEALNELHSHIPGKLYVHLGSLTPVERGLGAGLMHSKLFYARSGNTCRLWTGSHNLTASAMQGVNCEAAVLLEGQHTEPAFQEALAHLNACRSEAMLFDPLNPPPSLSSEQTLVIHAEIHATLKRPPWFVHIRPDNTDYDRAMRPRESAWIYLYSPGTLRLGRSRPPALQAFSGTLTALNFTERHPTDPGISADWGAADYVIEIRRGVPCLTDPTPHSVTPSQGIVRVKSEESADAVWFSESPKASFEREIERRHFTRVDPEFRKFFTKDSFGQGGLLHQIYGKLKTVLRVPRKEMGAMEQEDLLSRLKTSPHAQVVVDESLDAKDKFAFIYRAKYRA